MVLVAEGSDRFFDYEDVANDLFYGFLVILGLPLGVIIPFSAFRSLSREYEDGTIQLISITTMKPYQIVLGKFGTAMLQMVIYLSVVAPCLVLTYMLEGITFLTIMISLGIAVGGCVVLTIFGLLLAGASRSYAFGLAISTAFVLGLGGLYIGWVNLVEELYRNSPDANFFQEREAFISLYGMIAFFGSTAALMLTAAASQISFESDNRSTRIRFMLLFQLMLYFGLLAMLLPEFRMYGEEISLAMTMFIGHYWLVMGGLLIGESGDLSRRVQRSLPQSGWKRTLFSLLMPGPGRGFLFALAGFLACIVAVFVYLVTANAVSEQWLMSQFSQLDPPYSRGNMVGTMPTGDMLETACFMAMLTFHPMCFLSIAYLVMVLIRRGRKRFTGALGPVISLFLTGLMVAGVSIASLAIWEIFNYNSRYSYGSYNNDLTISESLNWYLVVNELFRGSGNAGFSNGILSAFPFFFFSALVTLLAIGVAVQELRIKPIAVPTRVVEDIEREKAVTVAPGESIEEIWDELDRADQDKADQ